MSVSNQRHHLAYDDLRGWLAEAERMGELRTVRGANWQEEIGMAADLVCRSETAPAVLFDEVPGCRPGFRVLINLLGGRRMHMTLGFPTHLSKAELSEAYLASHIANRKLIPYQIVEDGPIFQNVLTGDKVDLDIFPAPMWHEKDGGRYIGTGCYNVSMDPQTRWINLGTYRIMTRDKTSVTYNANLGKHGQVHQRKWAARGEKMPVALVIGGDPIIFLLGGSDIADGICEYDVAGGLRGKPVRVVQGRLTGLPIPADAEIVLEGFVHPDTLVDEGPFGDWTGTYSDKGRKRPLVEIAAIYHRDDPIILGCPPQKPPDEYSRIASVTRSARLLQNIRDAGVPDVSAAWCHEVGGARSLIGVAIKQRYPGHARQAGHVAAACQTGNYASKWIVVTDDDVDVTDTNDLLWAWMMFADPATSLDLMKIGWTSPGEPRIPPWERARGNISNARMIVDACRPFHWRDQFPEVNAPSRAHAARAREKFGNLLDPPPKGGS